MSVSGAALMSALMPALMSALMPAPAQERLLNKSGSFLAAGGVGSFLAAGGVESFLAAVGGAGCFSAAGAAAWLVFCCLLASSAIMELGG